MKTKWKVLAIIAAVAVLIASIGSAIAYFSTSAKTLGEQPVSLGTSIEETVSDWTKHVVVSADEDSFPVYVRARAFTDSRFTLTYSWNGDEWKDGGDGFYYYYKVVNASESTTELNVKINNLPADLKEGFDFNVIVIYECTRATDEDGQPIAANWNDVIDLNGGDK
ncbi:MAG: hypothetical protein J5589_07620 [Firmicutes bacterium]|nr:hypothetical protein [Bacillota bacterium]